jgi:hypothetical protein
MCYADVDSLSTSWMLSLPRSESRVVGVAVLQCLGEGEANGGGGGMAMGPMGGRIADRTGSSAV